MKKGRTISNILRTAAEDMETLYDCDIWWSLACCARIEAVAWKKRGRNIGEDWILESDQANIFFAELFMPKNKTRRDYWFGDPYSKRAAEHRMLALYLASHIAYSEGL